MIDLENDIEELAKLLGIDKKEAKKKALEEGVKLLRRLNIYSILNLKQFKDQIWIYKSFPLRF